MNEVNITAEARLKSFSFFLIMFNLILLPISFFVLPIYQSMQGNKELVMADIFRLILIAVDLVLAIFIYQEKKWPIYAVGVTSLAMFLVVLFSRQLYEVIEIAKNSFWLLVYSWDFILLMILRNKIKACAIGL